MTPLSERARWKHVELQIARDLGGVREPITGRARGSAPDIRHRWMCIEVKSWARIPQLVLTALAQATACSYQPGEQHKLPIAILHTRGKRLSDAVVVLNYGDFRDWFVNEQDEDEREVLP